MADLVVTCPKDFWLTWLAEGDLPGDPPGGAFDAYDFSVGRHRPPIQPGERLYIVAHGRLRGYAPVTDVRKLNDGRWSIVRRGGAVACTIVDDERGVREVPGFRGYRQRWWSRVLERPFPDWRHAGVEQKCRMRHGKPIAAVLWLGRLNPVLGFETRVYCSACVAQLRPGQVAAYGWRVLVDLQGQAAPSPAAKEAARG